MVAKKVVAIIAIMEQHVLYHRAPDWIKTMKSEVARILEQIRSEYEAAHNGLHGLAQGTTRHSFITARMENMGKLQEELDELVGDNALALIITALEDLPNSAVV